jgi:hypothetical protein
VIRIDAAIHLRPIKYVFSARPKRRLIQKLDAVIHYYHHASLQRAATISL